MEDVLRRSFSPHVLVVASAECEAVYNHPLLENNSCITSSSGLSAKLCTLPQIVQNECHLRLTNNIDVESMIRSLRASNPPDFYHAIAQDLVETTFQPENSQSFETFGHPIACILVVSSSNPSPISALTQLYQQSYFDCPPGMSADFLRCVWYIHDNNEQEGKSLTTEDFATVNSQFGPHCFEVDNFDAAIGDAVNTTVMHSVYPYMQRLKKEWQLTHNKRSGQSAFGLGKFIKKFVTGGPPRPESNVFIDVCREMQPHVASIPARKRPESLSSRPLDVNLQLRRLADVAFMLKDYKLAYSAYESLRKPFSSEQEWALYGGCSEMVAICGSLASLGEVSAAVDSALYTYNSRLHLPAHALRCVLVVCGCLLKSGDQLLAAGLLSTTLLEVDPVYGQGDVPGQTAMLMERIATAFDRRGWTRKSKLWSMLAEREWERVPV